MATVTVPPGVIEIGSTWPTTDGGTDPPEVVVDPLTVTLTSPADGATVATTQPPFVVSVDTDDEDEDASFTLTVEYDVSDLFTAPTTLTTTFDTIDGGAVLIPASAVPAAGYWRAQVSQGSTLRSEWTEPAQYTVNVDVDPGTLAVTWTVDAGTQRRIHLWHLDPPGPVVGELVTVYGQGFPATGHLSWGDDTITPERWQLVPASGDNTVTAGRIDADIVTPEHYEIVFAAPEANPAGALLTVST